MSSTTHPAPVPPESPGVTERAGYIGGSDAAAILSLSPYATPFQVFCSKVGVEVARAPDPAREEKFEFGHLLEPVIAKAFAKRYSIPLRRSPEPFYRGAVRTFMGGHLDFELTDDSRVFVECKNIENEYQKDWDAPAASITEDSSSAVPLYYLAQCDHYLDLRDAPYCYLVALFGGCRLRVYRINRSPEREKYLLEAESRFWDRVLRDDPPPLSGIDDLMVALRSGYLESYTAARAKQAKKAVQLDEVGAALVETAYRARLAAKSAKKQADVAKNALLVHLGGETGYLQVGDERYGSFLVQEREKLDDDALKIAYPEIHAKFIRKAIYGPVLRLTKAREGLIDAATEEDDDSEE